MRDTRPPRDAARARHRRESWDFGSVEIVLQPIVDVSNGLVIAAEALARFPRQAGASVEEVFAVAHASGRGYDLEAACLRAALSTRAAMPSDVYLSVNVSPDALAHPAVQRALRGDLSGIVIEVTEHAAGDVKALRAGLADVRARGGRIAIDDATTGYAGLLRLTSLRPDIVKLDRELVRGVRDNVEQAAVIEALVSLSRRLGASVLGEGVESVDDLTTLAELDVDYAQGWFVARPASTLPGISPDAVRACRGARRALMTTTAVTAEPVSSLHTTTAALAGSFRPADLQLALNAASHDLQVDQIALSTMVDGGFLKQITASDAEDDQLLYAVSRFPATQQSLETGVMAEVHLNDVESDPAERALLSRDGLQSMLLTPVLGSSGPLGILEFGNRVHRRWTSHDLHQARTLAEHVASALQRMQWSHHHGHELSAVGHASAAPKRSRRRSRQPI
jgi:EAL domain-containing protein (putative c-di-GMP-specific phosphodiesterase class I)